MDSNPQWKTALDKGNRSRKWRAERKRELVAGTISPEEWAGLIRNPPEEMATMKLKTALTAVPKIGRKKSDRWCKSLGLRAEAPLNKLTDRQRRLAELQLLDWRARQGQRW